jgi:hypothetical protein
MARYAIDSTAESARLCVIFSCRQHLTSAAVALSALAVPVTCYDMPTLQLDLHRSENVGGRCHLGAAAAGGPAAGHVDRVGDGAATAGAAAAPGRAGPAGTLANRANIFRSRSSVYPYSASSHG